MGKLVILGALVVLFACLKQAQTAGKFPPEIFVNHYNSYKRACVALGFKHHCKRDKNKDDKKIVAFHARLDTSPRNLGKHKPVKFNTVLLNEGNAYNATSGMFTAPKDGIYSFDWTILSVQGYEFHTTLVHNNKPYAYSYCVHVIPCSQAAVVKMKKADRVWIRTTNNGEFGNNALSSFSGYKL